MNHAFRAWIAMLLLTLATLLAGYGLGERQGLLIGFIVALGVNAYVFLLGDAHIRSLFRVRQLQGQDPWGILSIVRSNSKKMRLRRPKAYVFPLATPTAFALSPIGGSGSIYISRGLIEEFKAPELEVVILFLLIQLRRKDTVGLQISGHLAEVLMGPAEKLDRLQEKFWKRELRIFSRLAAPVAALFILLSIGRRSFLDCDQEVARLIQNPELVATVLWKLRARAATSPFFAPFSVAHLFVVNPSILRGWLRYFPIQPSVQTRIQRLVGRFPL